MAQVPDWSTGGTHVGRIKTVLKIFENETDIGTEAHRRYNGNYYLNPNGSTDYETKKHKQKSTFSREFSQSPKSHNTVYSKCRVCNPKLVDKRKSRTFSVPTSENISTNPEMMQMVELLDKGFKAAIIHMLHEVMVNWFEKSGRTEVLSEEIAATRIK